MTSSREEQDLLDSYQLGVNAYVVKPVQFHEFVDAVKQVGGFWGLINEPPPGSLHRSERARSQRTREKTEDQT
jgi:DNA-binding NarL/FixJ family response regulator